MPGTSLDPNSLLDVAVCLCAPAVSDIDAQQWGDCEDARLRSAAGRAYYAVFLLLKRRLVTARKWSQFPEHKVHWKIRRAVEMVVTAGHMLPQAMKQLHIERGDADYELGDSLHRARAEDRVDLAADAADAIAALTVSQVAQIAEKLYDLDRETRP